MSGPVQDALRELAGLGATGALHVEAGLGAVLYLRGGSVTHVDAAASPGIGRLLLASGRLSEKVWGGAINAGARTGRVGALLVEQGHLSEGELELCVTGALHDAAFFALGTEPTSVRFASGESSWFGTATGVAVELLVREAARRRELLEATLESSAYDEVPFVPVSRLPRQHIVLDEFRWELLVHADGRRTPLELARLLGRGGYATLFETRKLAAAGLLRLPMQGPELPARNEPAPPSNGAPGAAAPKTTNGKVSSPQAQVAKAAPEVPLPPLPRRRVTGWRRGANQPIDHGPAEGARSENGPAGGQQWPTPPPEIRTELPTVSMLTRFRDALEGFR